MEFEYRADGWPLCPNCGEDELYSALNWNGEGERPLMQAWIDAGLTCYRCGWSDARSSSFNPPFFQRPVPIDTGYVIKGDKYFKQAMREMKLEISASLINRWSWRISTGMAIVKLGLIVAGLGFEYKSELTDDVQG